MTDPKAIVTILCPGPPRHPWETTVGEGGLLRGNRWCPEHKRAAHEEYLKNLRL